MRKANLARWNSLRHDADYRQVPPPPSPVRPEPAPARPTITMDELFNQNIQAIYFDFDSVEIRPGQLIEGHCDERSGHEYNFGLGDRGAL